MKALLASFLLLASCGGSQKRDLTKYNAEDKALLETARFNCSEPDGTDAELAYLKALQKTIGAEGGEVVKVHRDDTNLDEQLSIAVPIDQAFTYNVNIATGAGGGEKSIIGGAVGPGAPAVNLEPDRFSLAVGIPPDTTEATYTLKVGFEAAPEKNWACVEYVISRFPKQQQKPPQ